MRVLCISESARMDGMFRWVDFPSSSGRLDIFTRCVQTVFGEPRFVGVVEGLYLVFWNTNPPNILQVKTPTLREGSLRSEFVLSQDLKQLFHTEHSTHGEGNRLFSWYDGGLESLFGVSCVDHVKESKYVKGDVVILDEGGIPLEEYQGDLASAVVVVGDQRGLPSGAVLPLEEKEPFRISLGQNSYLSSQSLFFILCETLKREYKKLGK